MSIQPSLSQEELGDRIQQEVKPGVDEIIKLGSSMEVPICWEHVRWDPGCGPWIYTLCYNPVHSSFWRLDSGTKTLLVWGYLLISWTWLWHLSKFNVARLDVFFFSLRVRNSGRSWKVLMWNRLNWHSDYSELWAWEKPMALEKVLHQPCRLPTAKSTKNATSGYGGLEKLDIHNLERR